MECPLGQTKRTTDRIDIRAPKRRARTTVPAAGCPAQTPNASIRDLFTGYEPHIAADCDDIDTLVAKADRIAELSSGRNWAQTRRVWSYACMPKPKPPSKSTIPCTRRLNRGLMADRIWQLGTF
ncbi:uncharacterized protein N7518_009516 [Penicillium psychrosexuale]|uniref:uncharacterized protein n=1 Tax=Penicillium psychrosexuale TaxID=1002107 RepID=UPI002545B1D3|nr:uncharacterized protein N7518_009516 [Penicillium psychrosexuale]KAJ5783839.1 hypothetical protein N7518_009516 [Penicillium psychrosexuale]